MSATGDSRADATPREVQEALVAAIKAYARRLEAGERFPPFEASDGVTATEAVTVCSRILRATDVALMDLAMWEMLSID
jgi:hypothetical protein